MKICLNCKYADWKRTPDAWRVDLSTCIATHDSGLSFSFEKSATGEWNGKPVGLDDWQDELLKKMPKEDVMKHGMRLANEAREAYLWQLKKLH